MKVLLLLYEQNHEVFIGSSINYVKCMECNYESKRQEKFLDICFTVKNKIDKVKIKKKSFFFII